MAQATTEAAVVRYSGPAQAMHWLTVLVVFSTIPAGIIMLRPGIARPLQDALFTYHKNIGLVILALILARLIYRLVRPAPPLPASVPPLQRGIAHATHWLLYGLIIVMAVSGYIRVVAGGFPLEVWDALGVPRIVSPDPALAERAKAIHAFVRIPLVLLIAIHVGAALYHALIKRDGVFSRMLPGR
ncbi:MAG: cytochrome b [Devosia sp.]